MNHKELLKDFYKAYLHWVETGENLHEFDSDRGLCSNLDRYYTHLPFRELQEISEYQSHLFEEANLCYVTPFNGVGNMYYDEVDKRLNPARIQWVKDFLND